MDSHPLLLSRSMRKYKATFHASLFHRPRAHPRAPLPPGARAWGRPARPAPHPLESASPGGAGRALGSPRYRELPLGLASAWRCGHAWCWVTGSEGMGIEIQQDEVYLSGVWAQCLGEAQRVLNLR